MPIIQSMNKIYERKRLHKEAFYAFYESIAYVFTILRANGFIETTTNNRTKNDKQS